MFGGEGWERRGILNSSPLKEALTSHRPTIYSANPGLPPSHPTYLEDIPHDIGGRTVRRLVSLFTLLLFLGPAALLAAAKTESRSFTLYNSAQLGSVQLKPGDYRVEWTQTGANVPVTIVKDGKTVAQVHANVVEQKSSYDSAAVDMTKQPNGKEALKDIQFSKVLVKFNGSSAAGASGSMNR